MSRVIHVTYCPPRGRWAEFADDYRYRLVREWDPDGCRVLFCMLNPSAATVDVDDPTVHRCALFAKRWGYGSVEVVNLFALISTDPAGLARHPDPVGPLNDSRILTATQSADTVVVAWGGFPIAKTRAEAVLKAIRKVRPTHCLGFTAGLAPRHPLYVRACQPLIQYT